MFTPSDLINMRAAFTNRLQDNCYIQEGTETKNTFGEIVITYANIGSEIACGLDMRPGSETRKPNQTVITYDAIIRLEITVDINEKQRIQITKRYGEPIVAIFYDIASPIQRGPAGIRILLNKVKI